MMGISTVVALAGAAWGVGLAFALVLCAMAHDADEVRDRVALLLG
jgi:hypothetical protein